MQLKADIQYVKGVGPARAEAFHKLSVDTAGALLRYYPRAYEDWSQIVPIREMPENTPCCIRATVCHTPEKIRVPGGLLLFKTSVTDGEGLLNLTFFNNKYIGKMLKEGEEYLFLGLKIVIDRGSGKGRFLPDLLERDLLKAHRLIKLCTGIDNFFFS